MLRTQHEPPTAGLLAGDGTAMIHLLVYLGPVPTEPPAAVAEHVEAVRDEKGAVRDWRFRGTSLHRLGQQPRDEFLEYRHWRSGYVLERVIGERATVQHALAWAAQQTDVSALQVLRLPRAHWELTGELRAEEQARRAAAACRASKQPALGIIAQPDAVHTHPRLLRGFAVDEPLLLLANSKASVTGTQDAVLLEEAGSRHTVHGWRNESGAITATADTGQVPLGDSPGAALLNRLAPGVPTVAVGPVTLSSAFGLVFSGLAEMAHEATCARTALWARVGS